MVVTLVTPLRQVDQRPAIWNGFRGCDLPKNVLSS